MQQIVRYFLVISNLVLRNKWKIFKDQFNIEFGKIKPPHLSEYRGENYELKWPHYMSSLFLKDTVKPRAMSSNINSDKMFQCNAVQSHQMRKLLDTNIVEHLVTMTIVTESEDSLPTNTFY